MKKEALRVEGMSCNHCVAAIEGALQKIDVKAKVDLSAKTVSVEYDDDKVSLDTVKYTIEDQGYDVV
ncbi:copper ion binding protein [Paenactinomyces guangxiensis]|uniref:Heavy-metal-associated domain-containing protein n=1 Tax=Paenactinomyces guangxiensis TaxID=1490290 RepID=A0A7W2A963_9BACL|nr:copper ion binding protein [Paenactinomyces guangxiensis]MBA4494884.1 heavy-metal-associated domain-containing protein [Paenactinomyces guangxiensis]MBH8591967.1 heavy-metal-associated domain-containing protein [Paenactinomyces guangxiensis]